MTGERPGSRDDGDRGRDDAGRTEGAPSDDRPRERPRDDSGKARRDETLGPNEMYCYSCSSKISREAEICPNCGVRQRAPPSQAPADRPPRRRGGGQPAGPPPQPQGQIPPERQRELEKMAANDLPSTLILSLFLPPFAYLEVGKTGFAIASFLTGNFLMLGTIVVPIHTYSTVKSARKQLRTAGVEGY